MRRGTFWLRLLFVLVLYPASLSPAADELEKQLLVALADAGVVRRDTWEDYYDQVITALWPRVRFKPSPTRS